MATAAQAKPPETEKPVVRPIERERITDCSFALGEMQLVTLPGEMTIEPGQQNPVLWDSIAGKLRMHQWVQVSNDAGSFWRVMRVERIHGGSGQGLRLLILKDVVPPQFIDLANEPIVSTGDWEVRHGGPHRRWMVIRPNGTIRAEGLNTEQEARTIANRDKLNPRPL
jgi:hypothetical protein